MKTSHITLAVAFATLILASCNKKDSEVLVTPSSPATVEVTPPAAVPTPIDEARMLYRVTQLLITPTGSSLEQIEKNVVAGVTESRVVELNSPSLIVNLAYDYVFYSELFGKPLRLKPSKIPSAYTFVTYGGELFEKNSQSRNEEIARQNAAWNRSLNDISPGDILIRKYERAKGIVRPNSEEQLPPSSYVEPVPTEATGFTTPQIRKLVVSNLFYEARERAGRFASSKEEADQCARWFVKKVFGDSVQTDLEKL
jgi:hypothetical protein